MHAQVPPTVHTELKQKILEMPLEVPQLVLLLSELEMAKSNRRPLQDYTTWPNFGTRQLWSEMEQCPPMASEILCEYMHSLGLCLPTEPTSASIAAASAIAQYGNKVFWIHEGILSAIFKNVKAWFQKRNKQQPPVYLTHLPATPARLLKDHRELAERVYSATNLPCVCPYSSRLMSAIYDRIKQRGGTTMPPHGHPSSSHHAMHPMGDQMALLMAMQQLKSTGNDVLADGSILTFQNPMSRPTDPRSSITLPPTMAAPSPLAIEAPATVSIGSAPQPGGQAPGAPPPESERAALQDAPSTALSVAHMHAGCVQ